MTVPAIKYAADGRRIYEPGGVTLAAFLMDRSRMAIIRGPWASGKTAACCQRIFQHAVEQNTDSYGRRRSRWFVIREDYPKLEATAMKTWMDWYPEKIYGKLFTGARPYRHEVRVGNIELDVHFLAVGDLADESVWLSLEPTGLWWNELTGASMDQFFAAHKRVGRFPPLIEGGSSWSGTIADLNAPPANHWLPMLTGEVDLPDEMPPEERLRYTRPTDFVYLPQPPAVFEVRAQKGQPPHFDVNPNAENIGFLEEGYYQRAMQNASARWIRANLCNQIIPFVEGEAVWTNFDDATHVSSYDLEPRHGDVWVGLDFGRRPFAVFGQRIGRVMQVQFEAWQRDSSAARFAPEVRNVLAKFYPWVLQPGAARGSLRIYGDPKGQDGQQNDETTAYDVFRANGLFVTPAPVKQNSIRTRVETVEYAFDRNTVLISPKCRRLRMACAGGYRFPKERPSPVEERKPIKDAYSDAADALQYLLLGAGEGDAMVGREARRPMPVSTVPAQRSHRRGAGA